MSYQAAYVQPRAPTTQKHYVTDLTAEFKLNLSAPWDYQSRERRWRFHWMMTLMSSLCWTEEHYVDLAHFVRRHAFDFNAASLSFQQHLQARGVTFRTNEVEPQSLRKRFAGIDQKRADHDTTTRADAPALRTTTDAGTRVGTHEETRSINEPEESDHGNGGVDEPNFDDIHPCSAGDGIRASRCTWDFETVLEEERERREHHKKQRDLVFRRVLAAIGGPLIDPAELPLDILRAWEARKHEAEAEAREAEQKRRDREERRERALERERLRRRHVPGGEDSTGEDPLADSSQGTCYSSCDLPSSPKRGVKLELGIDATELDTLLSEIEASRLPCDDTETDSELSNVLDFLDKAAGNSSSRCCTRGGEYATRGRQ